VNSEEAEALAQVNLVEVEDSEVVVDFNLNLPKNMY
jgi:hypothetical protein